MTILKEVQGEQPAHIQVVRGTFDPSQLEQATLIAASIAEELGRQFGHFVRLDTLWDRDKRFIWLAHFGQGIPPEDIDGLMSAYRQRATGASVEFEIEEFRPYQITYSGPAAASTPAD